MGLAGNGGSMVFGFQGVIPEVNKKCYKITCILF